MTRLPDEAKCLACGYLLRELAEARCPECGRAFDPANSTTCRRGGAPGRIESWLLKPPAWPLIGASAVAMMGTLAAASGPTLYLSLSVVVALLWLLLSAVWFLRFVVAGVLMARRGARPERPRHLARWSYPPVLFVAAVVLAMSRLPFYVAYWVSLPDMNAVAAQAVANPASVRSRACVGVFPVSGITVDSRGVWIRVRDTLGGGGLAKVSGPVPHLPYEPYLVEKLPASGWATWELEMND